MRLVPDAACAAWLAQQRELEWDAGNRTKSEEKHGFSMADVESLFARPLLFAGAIVEPEQHAEPRFLLLGSTSSGRRVALVFTRREERLRPISCRAMRKREKEVFDAAT